MSGPTDEPTKPYDPADVVAGHMPDQPADPTYGGGFRPRPGGPMLARPDDPATRGQVNALEGRVNRLEGHLFDPSETEENAEKAPGGIDYAEYAEPLPPLELVKGSVRGPGYLVGERADRAEALLGTVETVKTTGGAVEIAGVRIEPCDEYGRSATTKMLEDMIRQRDFAHRAIEVGQRETSSLLEKLDTARRQRDAARRDVETLIRQRDEARGVGQAADTSRCDAWIGGVGETAVRCHLSPDHTSPHEATLCGEMVTWGNPTDGDDALEPTDEEIGRGLIRCGQQRLVDVGAGRHALVACELPEHADDEPHRAGARQAVSW